MIALVCSARDSPRTEAPCITLKQSMRGGIGSAESEQSHVCTNEEDPGDFRRGPGGGKLAFLLFNIPEFLTWSRGCFYNDNGQRTGSSAEPCSPLLSARCCCPSLQDPSGGGQAGTAHWEALQGTLSLLGKLRSGRERTPLGLEPVTHQAPR